MLLLVVRISYLMQSPEVIGYHGQSVPNLVSENWLWNKNYTETNSSRWFLVLIFFLKYIPSLADANKFDLKKSEYGFLFMDHPVLIYHRWNSEGKASPSPPPPPKKVTCSYCCCSIFVGIDFCINYYYFIQLFIIRLEKIYIWCRILEQQWINNQSIIIADFQATCFKAIV